MILTAKITLSDETKRGEGRTPAVERKVLIRQSRNVGSGLAVQDLEDAVWLPCLLYT